MICGIYIIRNVVSGKRYVGQSADIENRWRQHLYDLRSSRDKHPLLHNAWKKYGENAFVFSIVETCERRFLTEAEQGWMDANKSADKRYGYNARPSADSMLGHRWTAEQLARVRGRKISQERIDKSRAGNLGKKRSPEARARLSAGQLARASRQHAPEALAKMSAARRGQPWTEARRNAQLARANMPTARRGKPWTEAMRRSHLARKKKPE
jgi:group I intron endonuclease